MRKILLLIFLIFSFSCSKEEEGITEEEHFEEEPTEEEPDTEPINENVTVVLDENSRLVSTESQLSNGIYVLEFDETPPEFAVNDVIVSDIGEGFLRKVSSSSVEGKQVTLETSQGTLEDVFKDAELNFSWDHSEGPENKGSEGVSDTKPLNKQEEEDVEGLDYYFNSVRLSALDPLEFRIRTGRIQFQPEFIFNSTFKNSQLTSLEFKTDNARLHSWISTELIAEGAAEVSEVSETLTSFSKRLKFTVEDIPVVVVVNTELIAELDVATSSELDLNTDIETEFILSTGVTYENEDWDRLYDLHAEVRPEPVEISGTESFTQRLAIVPEITVKFYGVLGFYCEPEITENYQQTRTEPEYYKDANMVLNLDSRTGVRGEIFGDRLEDYFVQETFEEEVWKSPVKMEIVSGNEQQGECYEYLSEEVMVKVTDNFGTSVRNVLVFWEVTEGDGSAISRGQFTTAQGTASTHWELGDVGDQRLRFFMKDPEGNVIDEVEFSAVMECPLFKGYYEFKVEDYIETVGDCPPPQSTDNGSHFPYIFLEDGKITGVGATDFASYSVQGDVFQLEIAMGTDNSSVKFSFEGTFENDGMVEGICTVYSDDHCPEKYSAVLKEL